MLLFKLPIPILLNMLFEIISNSLKLKHFTQGIIQYWYLKKNWKYRYNCFKLLIFFNTKKFCQNNNNLLIRFSLNTSIMMLSRFLSILSNFYPIKIIIAPYLFFIIFLINSILLDNKVSARAFLRWYEVHDLSTFCCSPQNKIILFPENSCFHSFTKYSTD